VKTFQFKYKEDKLFECHLVINGKKYRIKLY